MSSTITVPHLQARPRLSPGLLLAKTCRRREAIPFRCVAKANAVVPARFVGCTADGYDRKRTATIRQAVQTEKGSIADFGEEAYRLGLAPDEATRSLRFTEVRDGNDIRVVVSAVEEGSKAQEAGVRPGQRLLTVSDPINVGEDLEIVPGTKVKKVYDTIQLSRASEVSFQLSQSSVEDNPGFDVAKAQEGINLPQTGGSGQGSNVPSTQSARPMGGKSEMEQKYAKRMVMRDEYMNKEPSSDKGFFGLIFAMLIVPAIVILGIAFGSGYMDTISSKVTQ
ncbi:g13556 [Coccomyxa viridis]|uniref:G13556 protein n=1 Tax=Coccomyxa viridis TaxID=1274662 RepID=A0ABP1GK66_9CHLO